MKRILAAAALAGLALAACQKPATTAKVEVKAPAPASAQKAGLWEQTVSVAGQTQTTQTCVGPGATAGFSQVVTAGAKSCGPARLAGAAHGLDFDQDCDLGENGRQTAHGALTGSLDSSYRLVLTTTVTGAGAPLMNGTRTSVITAAWKGPCPPDLKPGEIRLPGGVKVKAP